MTDDTITINGHTLRVEYDEGGPELHLIAPFAPFSDFPWLRCPHCGESWEVNARGRVVDVYARQEYLNGCVGFCCEYCDHFIAFDRKEPAQCPPIIPSRAAKSTPASGINLSSPNADQSAAGAGSATRAAETWTRTGGAGRATTPVWPAPIRLDTTTSRARKLLAYVFLAGWGVGVYLGDVVTILACSICLVAVLGPESRGSRGWWS